MKNVTTGHDPGRSRYLCFSLTFKYPRYEKSFIIFSLYLITQRQMIVILRCFKESLWFITPAANNYKVFFSKKNSENRD